MDGNHKGEMPRRLIRTVAFAVVGAKTNLGSEVVTAGSTVEHYGRRIALVGDIVRHPELGDAVITTSKSPLRSMGQPLAHVGSLTSREGEFILDGGQRRFMLLEYDDGWVEVCGFSSDQEQLL